MDPTEGKDRSSTTVWWSNKQNWSEIKCWLTTAARLNVTLCESSHYEVLPLHQHHIHSGWWVSCTTSTSSQTECWAGWGWHPCNQHHGTKRSNCSRRLHPHREPGGKISEAETHWGAQYRHVHSTDTGKASEWLQITTGCKLIISFMLQEIFLTAQECETWAMSTTSCGSEWASESKQGLKICGAFITLSLQ